MRVSNHEAADGPASFETLATQAAQDEDLIASYFTRSISSIAPAGARTLPSWMT